MARTPVKTPEQKAIDPETRAYALVPVKGGWVARTYAIQGDRVLAYTDTEMDSKAPSLGRLVRLLERA